MQQMNGGTDWRMFSTLEQVLHYVLSLSAAGAQWRFSGADNVEVAVEHRAEASAELCQSSSLLSGHLPLCRVVHIRGGSAQDSVGLPYFNRLLHGSGVDYFPKSTFHEQRLGA